MTTIAPHLVPSARAVERPKTNALAVLSLVFGVLQYFFLFVPCFLVTIPFGVNALHQTDRRDVVGRRFAIAGLTFSATHFAVYAFVFIWLLTTR